MVRAAAFGMTLRERAAIIAVLAAMALVVLDAGMLNVALPVIAGALGETPAYVTLTITAYQTALVIGLLPCAQIAERFGYRRLFIAGTSTFLAASILCALAPSLGVLVAARIVQGLGGAAIMALGIALLRFALGSNRLGAAIGWNALTVALCTAGAPILGAAILSAASWPWLFLIKLPLGAAALVAAAFLPEVAPTRVSVDRPAIILHGIVAILVLVAAQTVISWPGAAAALLVAAIATAAMLVRRERASPAPLWPADLFVLRPFRIAVAASVCCFIGQSAGFLALPFYLQLGLGRSASQTAVILTCWPLAVAVVGPLASGLSQRFSPALLCTVGAIATGAGLLLAALWPVSESLWPLAIGASLGGIGFGLFQVPNNRTMFIAAPPARSAAAGGVQGSARLSGQTIGALLVGGLLALLPPVEASRTALGVASLFSLLAALVSALALPALLRAPRLQPRLHEETMRTTGANPL